jgi:hypothetical protein
MLQFTRRYFADIPKRKFDFERFTRERQKSGEQTLWANERESQISSDPEELKAIWRWRIPQGRPVSLIR